jgi:beta-glucanase (GH16 family)
MMSIEAMLTAAVLTAPTAAPADLRGLDCLVVPGQEWKLIFSDEFDGPALDETKWTHFLPWTGSDGSKQHHNSHYASYIMKENLEFRDGAAHLLTKRQDVKALDGRDFKYTQAMITTHGKFESAFGYFEVRTKVPVDAGPGLWPAFWTLQQGWPPEMDICEVWTGTNRMHFGLAYKGPPDKDGKIPAWWDDVNLYRPLPQGFNTYGMEWGPGYQIYNLNGKVTKEVYGEHVPEGAQYILLNSGVDADNPPNASTVFPNAFEVDYVRVYQFEKRPLLHHAGFEAGDFRGWKRSGRGIIHMDAGGNHSARLDVAEAKLSQTIYSLAPGKTYVVTCKARVAGEVTAQLHVGGEKLTAVTSETTSQQFATLTAEFVVPEGVDRATITLLHARGDGSVFFDEVTFAEKK